ncbi:hypothetical protein [Terrimonas pollutisoli]|uniref:hypothetical protein n=1 Tax=Terrimonas pollutisoli TaxID=3034147 RepID=UPI0023ECE549|nr:hypothetical protein [Terrimonas sp. H1YJ31]
MLNTLTSLSFLYALVIVILLAYGFAYYREFEKGGRQSRRFPWIFITISMACVAFLWINFHAPLRLKTFSNLDHHFLQHDGFSVTKKIELGKGDTVNYENSTTNSFVFWKQSGSVVVNSAYSEDPLYANDEDSYRILSVNYPAAGHVVSFITGKASVSIRVKDENQFELKIDEEVFNKQMDIKKGISVWNLFRDDDAFISSDHFDNEKLLAAFKNIFLLRDDVSRKGGKDLKFFLSGRLFTEVNAVKYEGRNIGLKDLAFSASLPDKANVAWGIGFLDNNRNQYKVVYGANDSFSLLSRYPIAYPLTEESRADWSPHVVSKFLMADANDMHQLPAVFKEGFMFSAEEKPVSFAPVLLTYYKNPGNEPLNLKISILNRLSKTIPQKAGDFFLPARAGGFDWKFSIKDTFQWEFAGFELSFLQWQSILFGSLVLFILLVFCTALVKPAAKQEWLWQLLSCIVLVMVTTRFFLYWRYKSFPPFEGMDLPSQQQLLSVSNFAIIVFAIILLGVIFGFGFLRYCYYSLKGLPAKRFGDNSTDYGPAWLQRMKVPMVRSAGLKEFMILWFVVLTACGAIAGINHFDPGVNRHLAIGLMIAYFLFLFISYRRSPLVVVTGESWWRIGTDNKFQLLINNPVKIILSISLLALFLFIDIGFAIVFLNFLLFNEAFLCINYGVSGLSAGNKKNAGLFGIIGVVYLLLFVFNLLFAPFVFRFLLNMPQAMYIAGYLLFAFAIAWLVLRISPALEQKKKRLIGLGTVVSIFLIAFFFFPKEKILKKAAMTKYRIDVLTSPVNEAIIGAYEEGATYEPVIRAAQNQWFINTFIYEGNNPEVQNTGFHLLPHAPQNKGAKYNAQATDLVTSRFLIAEHGKSAVLLYVALLLLPFVILVSFYKLYPDFTSRVNHQYPNVVTGFSVFNYLLTAALLVILAATGRYIFFGQDLPFGSILSKQSILFPGLLILITLLLFKQIPVERYANRRKLVPVPVVFILLVGLLFIFKPRFNKNKEFAVADLAKEMDDYVQVRLQPLFNYFDSAAKTRRLPVFKKDRLFCDSLRRMAESGMLDDANKFFAKEVSLYTRNGFQQHLDQRHMLFLDLNSGHPQLAVNENYFRVEPPPHLQQFWTGNLYGDTTIYNVALWNAVDGSVISKSSLSNYTSEPVQMLSKNLQLSFASSQGENFFHDLYLINRSGIPLQVKDETAERLLENNDSIKLSNPYRAVITDTSVNAGQVLTVEPDAFMKNYYVNGSRYYVYPMKEQFIWARHFAEAVSADYAANKAKQHAFVSLDFGIMNSLSAKIQSMMAGDTAYKKGAEYGVCIADGDGRIIALSDFIRQSQRPDPNDKPAFNKLIRGQNGFVSQSLLRKEIGNINLLRMNPGPGSTFKPIVFSAIASQLNWDWDSFGAEGFLEKQNYYGGEKVPEYDFEKDNGRITRIADYLKYSDNYYHSNVLLLGSYPKQDPSKILANYFVESKPGAGLHWPYFTYTGKQYWLNGFQNWPGYKNGKADFGLDSSFTTVGLLNNYGIYTHSVDKNFDMFSSGYDSLLFLKAGKKSGFILPEYSLFDQHGAAVNHRVPYDLFTSCFRGHVKGSSQVMVAPVKMLDAFGKMISQSRSYSLTLNPHPAPVDFKAFDVDNSIPYNHYLSIMRDNVFEGMKEALFAGTAARLGSMLKNGAPYFYYAKTGTTGDDELKTKSKLLIVVISSKDITDPNFNFRNNKFYMIYFTSQNGPAKQNEEFQAEVIRHVQQSPVFNRYMASTK